MKHPRILGLLALVGVLAVTVVGCIGTEGARGWAGPVQEGNVIVVSTSGGQLDGVSSDEGRQVWRFPDFWTIPDQDADDLDGIYGRPVFSEDGEVLFVGDYNGFVYAFRPGDFEPGQTIEGPPAASFELDGPVIGGVALDPGADVLYVTSDQRVYAIRASDLVARIANRDAPVSAVVPAPPEEKAGVLFSTGDEIWGEPVLADGKLLVSSLDGNLYAVDPSTGAEIWRFEGDKGLASTPVVAGDRVLVSGFGSTLFAVDLDDGSELWRFKAGHWIWGNAAIAEGVAYIGDFDGKVHALELETGERLWSRDLDRGALRASPAVVGDTLVVSSDGGWLLGIDTDSREVAWQRDIGTPLNADLTVDGDDVLLAPRGCVTPDTGGDEVYYTRVDPSNGDLGIAVGVC